MKVYLDNPFSENGVGGVARVYAGLHEYLPKFGVEIVEDIAFADVAHAHIALYQDFPVEKPLVVTSHGMLWESDKWGGSATKINKLCIEAYRQADVITAPSQFVAHAIARNMSRSVSVVRHGIDSQKWLPEENLGYVLWNKARVDPANDPKDLNALADFSHDVQFVTTYGKKSSNVKVIGQIPYEQMKDVVAHAGVYLDTPKESGGPCFGVLEAMSCGVPILSWDWGGTSEAVVHGETGYLAEPGNYEDLLQGMLYCLEHHNQLGQNARQAVLEKYQWSAVVQGYIQAYEEALEQRQPVSVSVIIPCYNLGSFLPACLESVQNQSFENWEVIVVDDCSTDNSLEIAQQYAEQDSRIRVLHNEQNRHVAYSRNRGIENARGAYILPLDADDRLESDALKCMVGILDHSRRYDIVSGKLMLYNEGNYTSGRLGEWPNNAEYDLQIQGYNRLPYASMYRRLVWESVGGYRTRIRNGVEDADFWTRVLSFGHRAKIIDDVTLLYTMRQNSLGKQNDKGADAWLPWFGWHYNPDITPFGAENGAPIVRAYDKPEVSVVIPVGPAHQQHLQACLDSLLAQINASWEAIVVNDSGSPLNVPPYVTLVDTGGNKGVAHARNKGIQAAKADKIIFLDADDVAQSLMIDLLLQAHAVVGGWIYADWYVLENDIPTVHTSLDWDIDRFKTKMLSPITGLYEKAHLMEVGSFDETAPGWEDWDMQLALVQRGYCGTRLQYPIITYNMGSGFRREENFSRANKLLQYIKNKYGDVKMACSKCGGKKTLKVNKTMSTTNDTQMVLLAYTGPMSQTRRIKSKTHRGTTYIINNRKPFFVFPDDVSFFLSIKDYKVVEQPKTITPTNTAVLVSQEKTLPKLLVDDLDIKPEIKTLLKTEYNTVPDLAKATDADLLKIKGMGPARVKEVRSALNA